MLLLAKLVRMALCQTSYNGDCEAVTVREGGEIKQMSAPEAMLKKLVSKGLGGDHKAILAVIGLAQKEGLLTPEQEQVVEDLSVNDLAILEDVKRRLDGTALDNLPEDPASDSMNLEALGQNEPVAP